MRRVGIVLGDVAVGCETDDLAKQRIGGLLQRQALVVLHLVAQTITEGQIQHAVRSEGNVPSVVVVTHLNGRLEQHLLVLHVHLQRPLGRASGVAQQWESAEDVDGTLSGWKFVNVPFARKTIALADGGVVRVDPHGIIARLAGLAVKVWMEGDANKATGTVVTH